MPVLRRDASLLARPRRRVSVVQVALERGHADLCARLDAFAERARHERTSHGLLPALVLRRRASSCPAALRRSLERRLAVLGSAPATAAPTIPGLFDAAADSDQDARDDEAMHLPAWADQDQERTELRRLLELSCRVTPAGRKLLRVARLVRLARQPVVVFTAYLDTLRTLRALLPAGGLVVVHGEQPTALRWHALDAFTAGEATVLLATDTAAEGLNLQARSRLVVHAEVPPSWRVFEQRNGRVDRYGQTRRVHVVVLSSHTTEDREALARLQMRGQGSEGWLSSVAPLRCRRSTVADRRLRPTMPARRPRADRGRRSRGAGPGAGVPDAAATLATVGATARVAVRDDDRVGGDAPRRGRPGALVISDGHRRGGSGAGAAGVAGCRGAAADIAQGPDRSRDAPRLATGPVGSGGVRRDWRCNPARAGPVRRCAPAIAPVASRPSPHPYLVRARWGRCRLEQRGATMSGSWVSGGRLWSTVVERQLTTTLMQARSEEAAARALRRCTRTWRAASETLGPASGASAVWAHLVRPCAEGLGWAPGHDETVTVAGVSMRAAEANLGPSRQLLLAMPWGMRHDGLQRATTKLGAQRAAAWVGACNGQTWHWYDTSRPYAREHVGFNLEQASVDGRVWQALWLIGQHARSGPGRRDADASWLEHLVASSHAESAGAAAALRDGVSVTLSALSARARGDHDSHVALVFQWLFLLFAEARALVPTWHPPHRRSYAISTVAGDLQGGRRRQPGVHESLVAIGRLGREGASIGGVRVQALGGPLFAGTLAARNGGRLPDPELGAMLRQLTHGATDPAARAIDFAQLGVEHLGSIYERLMAQPSAGAPQLLRKRTGAFYTPRLLADMVVERALDPLVRGASAREILGLRVLDPAMGSGALLASALRYLVAAVEAAWIREGRGGPLDVSCEERDGLARVVAEQCLYGVDINARAVEVGRLSLWLLSMAPDRPLTWLDAHLRVGNSLAGASPAIVLSRSPVRDHSPRRHADAQLTLFDLQHWHHEAAAVGPLLAALAARPTDSAAAAREKTVELAALRARAALATWRARADAWCGAAMDEAPVTRGTWRAVDDTFRDPSGASRVQPAAAPRIADHAARWQAIAQAQRCLHWSLEFPEVFEAGRGGFDAVLANPPWEMLRGDLGSGSQRAAHRDDLAPLLRFVRRSGLYRDGSGHLNSYQLFLERMLQLLRPGGRIGCLLPGGVLTDHGAAGLRHHLFEHAAVDRLSMFDNREALFPIHRAVRIVAVTATSGPRTESLLLDDGVQVGGRRRVTAAGSAPRLLPRALLERASGPSQAVPWLRDGAQVRLLEQLVTLPRLAGPEWGMAFGRELNATEDRALLHPHHPSGPALPVVDGKHLQAFAVSPPREGRWLAPEDARRVLGDERWRRWRLAYRDVSSPTNTRSLIAALLPPGCVSTHTLFCLRTRVDLATQLFLCGMLNSLVADWFVRRYIASHVTTRLMATVPVPWLPAGDAGRRQVVRLVIRLMRNAGDEPAHVALQTLAADLYGLDAAARRVVADDFPRLLPAMRQAMAATG